MRELKYGDRGIEVEKLQKQLIHWGLKGVSTVDGIFGTKTLATVKDFQAKRSQKVTYANAPLKPTGVVDLNTWAELTKTPAQDLISDQNHLRFGSHADRQIQAFLNMIRVPEGTSDRDGYRRIFTGRLFDNFQDHPRLILCAGSLCSDAAGAYQFLSTTWDAVAEAIKAKDFSPESQDKGAIQLIKWREAYEDIINGKITIALEKTSWEWASLPPGRYGQPSVSFKEAIGLFKSFGGKTNE